ncbi:MAG: dihydrodipicolinate synthase family protein [Bryobacteraceae bacterium]
MTDRRHFLRILGSAAVALPGFAGVSKPLRGIFPIMQTPYTPDDKIDMPVLAKQVGFLEKCGVHGMVWPQLASEYYNLTHDERIAGAEAILAAGKDVKPALVIGVQAQQAAEAAEFARHATKHGANALIALPPREETDWNRISAYYKTIGEATPLPLFVQAIGKVSVENIIDLSRAVPTLRYIKDEAGPVLMRISEVKKKAPELHPFTGGHSRTLVDEMMRGSEGSMPAAGWADLNAAAWDAFHAGDRDKALELTGKSLLCVLAAESYGLGAIKYVLHLRGVFPTYTVRQGKTHPNENSKTSPLDENAKRSIQAVYEHVKPYLKG